MEAIVGLVRLDKDVECGNVKLVDGNTVDVNKLGVAVPKRGIDGSAAASSGTVEVKFCICWVCSSIALFISSIFL